MTGKKIEDMPSLKGKEELNVIPSKEDVNYNKVYLFTDVSFFDSHPKNRKLDFKHCKDFKKVCLKVHLML